MHVAFTAFHCLPLCFHHKQRFPRHIHCTRFTYRASLTSSTLSPPPSRIFLVLTLAFHLIVFLPSPTQGSYGTFLLILLLPSLWVFYFLLSPRFFLAFLPEHFWEVHVSHGPPIPIGEPAKDSLHPTRPVFPRAIRSPPNVLAKKWRSNIGRPPPSNVTSDVDGGKPFGASRTRLQ